MRNKTNHEETPFLLIIDGSSLLSTQFFGNLPKEIIFAKTLEEKEQFFSKIMQTTTGVYTNAVYGFLRVMLKIIKDQKPKYIAVAWDVSRDTFRRELYPDYKGNRGETLEPLKDQFALCQDVLKQMNIPQFMDRRYEADDFSGSLCEKFEHDVPIRILTKDNDYLQLITEQTNVWLIHSTAKKTDELFKKYNLDRSILNVPDRTFQFTPELVKEEFGILPSSVPSLKGLQGDSSDNIKGVPGIGETTAVALIKEYETVDKLYSAIRDLNEDEKKQMVEYWKSIGIKRSPMNYLLKTSDTELVGEKAAYLSEQLATIKRDIDLTDVTLDSLTIDIDREKAQHMFDLLEFKSLNIDKMLPTNSSDGTTDEMDNNAVNSNKELEVDEEDLVAGKTATADKKTKAGKTAKSAIVNSDSNEESTTESNSENKIVAYADFYSEKEIIKEIKEKQFVLVKDFAQADSIFNEIKEVSLKNNSPVAFQLLADKSQLFAVSLTFADAKQEVRTVVIITSGFITEQYLLDQVNSLIKSKVLLCTNDLKKQLQYLQATEEDNILDIAIAAYLCDPVRQHYEFSDIAKQVFGIDLLSEKETLGKSSYENFYESDEANFLQLCGYSSVVSYFAKDVLLKVLDAYGMTELYKTIEMPLVYTLYDMQERGIKVNREELKEYGDMLEEGIKTLEKKIYEQVGEEFNINSPKQLGVILFEKMQLPFGKKTKTGYSTSAEVLEKLKSDHPVVEMILEYRQLTKLKSTYADGLDNYIENDERIHGIFNQTVTATGRISSTEPNLQNIPIRMELGRQIRKVFIPEDGFVFLDADYSQIELRVLAHMSGDERLIEAYKQEQDIHRLTASQVFHTPFDEVTSAQRSNAKAVNFGIVYGISAFSLSQDLDISRSDAEDYINKYFETYPRVKTFLDEQVENGRNTGVVTTLFGRIRPVPDLNNTNFMKRSAEERIAMNSPIQGTAADIIKIAMIRVNQELKKQNLKSRLLLQIHDELLVETEKSEIETVKEIIVNEMQRAAELLVPLVADVNEGKNWYEAK